MAGGSVGHLSDLKTTKLMTPTEAMKAMATAGTAAKSLPPPKGCGFRFDPATHSEMKAAGIPI